MRRVTLINNHRVKRRGLRRRHWNKLHAQRVGERPVGGVGGRPTPHQRHHRNHQENLLHARQPTPHRNGVNAGSLFLPRKKEGGVYTGDSRWGGGGTPWCPAGGKFTAKF